MARAPRRTPQPPPPATDVMVAPYQSGPPQVTGPAEDTASPAERRRHIQSRTELGVTGTPIFSGYILADPNSELNFPNSVKIYDKMRRTDGQVKAALLALMLPILSVEWTIEPYREPDPTTGKLKDPTPEAVEIANFVKADLLEGMTTPWKTVLRQILGMLTFGYSVFEKVWELGDDGLVHLRKLAPRLQPTIWRWYVARDGGLVALEQRGIDPSSGSQIVVTLPADSVVVYTHDKEGADWTGISVLRSAYKHFYFKEWLYRIGVINVERGGGVPVFNLPDEVNEDDLQRVREVGESFHMHEKAWVMVPFGYQFKLESGTSRIGDVMAQVTHHDTKISSNILAQFLDFGDGSRAGVTEFLDLFLMAEDSVIGNIEQTTDKYVIEPFCNLNWRVTGYPHLKAQNIRGFNVRRMGVLLRALADGQLIIPDENTEAFLRKSMGLPEADEATRRTPAAPSPFGAAPGGPPGTPGAPSPNGGPKPPPQTPGTPGAKPQEGSGRDNPAPVSERVTEPGDNPNPGDRQAREVQLAEGGYVAVRVPLSLEDAVRRWSERIPTSALAVEAGGLEDHPHISLKAGLDPNVGPQVTELVRGEAPVRFTFGKTEVFSHDDADVLYVAVTSPDLERLHDKLALVPAGPDTYPVYTPHLTLAYLRPGLGAVYAGDPAFAGLSVEAGSVWYQPAGQAGWEIGLAAQFSDTLVDPPLSFRRALTSLEQHVALHEIDAHTKRSARAMLATIAPIQQQQAEAVAKLAGKDLDGVKEFRVPYVGRMASAVKKQLADIFEFGRDQVRRELFRQAQVRRARVSPGDASLPVLTLEEWVGAQERQLAGPIATKGGAVDFIGAKADLLAQRWANRLKDVAINAKLRAMRAGFDEAEMERVIQSALGDVSGKAAKSIVLQTISEAFAMGRTVEAAKWKEDVEGMQYSALLDTNTCDVCEELDGQEGDLDDPEIQTPNPNCLGELHGNTCRCINVYALSDKRGEQ